ncbi:transposase [Pseudomonas sp. O64]|uniref:transposase n=1 Tax=Pseudomonas TaxID=286 RepID=UPI00387AB4D3
MHIPPASFRVTPYGEVDAKALDSLRQNFEIAQLLNVVDQLDACLAEIGGVDNIRDDFLRLHDMAMTLLECSPLTVATSDVDSIWEEALSLPTVTLIEELFDHLDKIASQQRGSVKCLSVWMSGLVYAKALLITDVERFLADAAALGGPSSVGPA